MTAMSGPTYHALSPRTRCITVVQRWCEREKGQHSGRSPGKMMTRRGCMPAPQCRGPRSTGAPARQEANVRVGRQRPVEKGGAGPGRPDNDDGSPDRREEPVRPDVRASDRAVQQRGHRHLVGERLKSPRNGREDVKLAPNRPVVRADKREASPPAPVHADAHPARECSQHGENRAPKVACVP